MANSIIEDVLNNPINEGGNGKGTKTSKPKKSKKVIIIFIVILIIIIACVVGAIFYLQNATTEISSKSGFFEYLSSNNLESVTEISSYEELGERLFSENNTTETNIEIEYETESLSISDIELTLNSESDIENSKSYTNATITYSDNDLFEFEILLSSDSIALKSDEVVTAYVDIPYEYINDLSESELEDDIIWYDETDDDTEYTDNVLEEVGTDSVSITTDEESSESETETTTETEETDEVTSESTENTVTNEANTTSANTVDEDTSDTSISDIEEVIEAIENIGAISDESIQIYKDILDKNLDETHFSSEVVTLVLDAGTISANKYSLTMTEEEFISIMKQCLEALETDTDTIDSISELLNILGLTEEEFVDSVDDLITELDEYELQGSNIVVNVYESEGQTVKIYAEYSEIKLEIEYEYASSENSAKVTLVDEDDTGVSCKITNTVSDLANQIDIDISIIEYSEVISTITISANLIGSSDSYTLDAGIYYQDTDSNSLDIVITNEIEFTDNVEIEDLTDENSVSIEDLSDEQLEQIYEQLQNVLNNKISQLSFIDANTSSTVVGQDTSEEDDDTKKEEIKEALILAVQEEMTTATENGEEYTIQNLTDLQIENYIVSVVISDNIATIDINGYTFYIDSDFNLSE